MINWQTFVVRIWQEAGSGAWRGQIVHLPDKVSRHFDTLAQAAAFIQQYVPGAGTPIEDDHSPASRAEEENR